MDTVLFDFGQKQRPLAQGAIPTMLISNLKSLGAVAGLLAGLALGTALAAVFSSAPIALAKSQKPTASLVAATPRQQDANKALAETQLKLARQALEELDSLYKQARLSPLDSRIAVWERRQVEALSATGVGKAERLSAIEAYVNRMKRLSAIAEETHKQGTITGADVLDWQYRVLEAEMWLNQEKLR